MKGREMKKQMYLLIGLIISVVVYGDIGFFESPNPVIKKDREVGSISMGAIDNGQVLYPEFGTTIKTIRPTGYGFNYWAVCKSAFDESIVTKTKFRIDITAFQWGDLYFNYYDEDYKFIDYPKYAKSDRNGYATFKVEISRNEEHCENTNHKFCQHVASLKAKSGQRSTNNLTMGMREHNYEDWPDYWMPYDEDSEWHFTGLFYGSQSKTGDGVKSFPKYPPVIIGTDPEDIGKSTVQTTQESGTFTVTAVGDVTTGYILSDQLEFRDEDIELAEDEIAFLSETSLQPPLYGIEFIGPVQWRYITSIELPPDPNDPVYFLGTVTDREISVNDNAKGLSCWEVDNEASQEQLDFEIKALGGWYMPEMWIVTAEPLCLGREESIMKTFVTCPGYCPDPNDDPNVVFSMDFCIAESSDDGLRHLVRPYLNYIAFTDANGIGFEPYPIEMEETDPNVTIWHVPLWDKSNINFDIYQADNLIYPFWLSDNTAGDLNGDGIVNLKDWAIATTAEDNPYPLVSSLIPQPPEPLDLTEIQADVAAALADPDVTFGTLQSLYLEVLEMKKIAPDSQQDDLQALQDALLNKMIEILFG